MWDLWRNEKRLCVQYREALEDLSPGLDEAAAQADLKNNLPAEVMGHAEKCDSCEEAALNFWESRNLVAIPSQAARVELRGESAPWFEKQVMAKILERETEGRRAQMEWSGAVTKLASRLVWSSALVLLVGATWLYVPNGPDGQNGPDVTRQTSSAVQPGESGTHYLFESGSATPNVEDALAGPAER
jgi:hypothetical protein